MIERIDNGLQIAVLAACGGVALIRALRSRGKPWTLLALFYGSWLLGDVYWAVCLFFYGQTPQISVVSDLSWYASYIFLYMLLREIAPPVSRRETRLLPWLGPVFAFGMAVFFMRWGEVASNLIYAGLMGLLLFASIRRLMDGRRIPHARLLCAVILCGCLTEYALWTASCYWAGETLANPYYWFDLLLTAGFVLLLPAAGKGRSLPRPVDEAGRRKPNEQGSAASDQRSGTTIAN